MPPRMPCRCLKFSTHPELALNLSSEIPRYLAVSLAFWRIMASVKMTLFFLHSNSHLWSCSSTSGNFEGLQSKSMSVFNKGQHCEKRTGALQRAAHRVRER